jgi:large subunit ribosomal protein L19
MGILEDVQKTQMKDTLPQFEIGDTVDVHVKIEEGDKERVQVFNGTVIARKGSGMSEMFTVRRIVAGEGVERVFPIHSPTVVDVQVVRRGHVRRAKLYYLRDRVGKRARVREKRREAKDKDNQSPMPDEP